jgi:dihydroxyacetone kinase-like protein
MTLKPSSALRRAGDRVRTLGVALSPVSCRESVKPVGIGDNEMEIGMGIHGESGIRRGPQLSAEQIAEDDVLAAGGLTLTAGR